MRFDLDLDDLRRRESERIEWKASVHDIEDVIETIVAFSNDFSNIGGGYVICGAEERKDKAGFPMVNFDGLYASRFKEIEGKVLSDCQNKVDPPIVPLIDEINVPGNEKKVLVFIIPSTEYAHSFRKLDGSTKYYVRIGRTTREARGAILRELLIRKKVLEPFDRRPNKTSSVSDLDLLIMREYLQNMGIWDPARGIEKYLSGKETLSAFVPPLFVSDNLTNTQYPRNFALLLFCANPSKLFQGAYTILSVYPAEDRSSPLSERTEIAGTIVEQAKQVITRLNTESFTAFDKTSPHPNQLKYPIRALQEAVVNAIVHRDYESDQPTRITIFSDRVEINSAGALPRAVDKQLFIKGEATPYWRNQTLAFFFNKLQLSQAEGQGISTILRTMREEGCPEPIFQLGEENVVCTLPAHPRHRVLSQIREIENDIVLGNHGEALLKTKALLDKDPYNFRALELYCEVCNLVKKPELVFEFVTKNKITFTSFPLSTIILVAQTLILCSNNEEAKNLADKLLSIASAGRLEEREIKKIAVGIRKIGDDEKAIEFLDKAIERLPSLRTHSSLLEIRGKAKIDLAKRCIDTAKKRDSSKRIKFLAWEKCRDYINDAEKDLNVAFQYATGVMERDFVRNDLDFLARLKEFAKKPLKTSGSERPRYKRSGDKVFPKA